MIQLSFNKMIALATLGATSGENRFESQLEMTVLPPEHVRRNVGNIWARCLHCDRLNVFVPEST